MRIVLNAAGYSITQILCRLGEVLLQSTAEGGTCGRAALPIALVSQRNNTTAQ